MCQGWRCGEKGGGHSIQECWESLLHGNGVWAESWTRWRRSSDAWERGLIWQVEGAGVGLGHSWKTRSIWTRPVQVLSSFSPGILADMLKYSRTLIFWKGADSGWTHHWFQDSGPRCFLAASKSKACFWPLASWAHCWRAQPWLLMDDGVHVLQKVVTHCVLMP